MEHNEKTHTPENKKTSLIQLFFAFLRLGALLFGGGYAMLPVLERECVEKHGWITCAEMLDFFAISQCLPGLIATNTATFIGTKERGVAGAAVSVLGVIAAPIVVILIIAVLLANFADIPAVQHAFGGIRVAVCVLILNAVIKLIKGNVKNWLGIALCVAAFALIALFSISPAFVVLGAALVGIGKGSIEKRSHCG